MGFGGIPPRLDVATLLQAVDLWSPRAEMVAIHEELPWAELLAGADPDTLLLRDKAPLVAHYRSKGLKLLVQVELNDGLNRAADAPQLRALGRSLAEPAVQQLARRWARAVAQRLQPDWLGLASETNLVRELAPPTLYAAVRRCANDTASELRSAGLARPPQLLASVQVETAWGLLPGMAGGWRGVAADRSDFAFADSLGLSSYPYLAHATPQALPADWYSRVVAGSGLPTLVVEGGWSSAPSPELQQAYIQRHATLLDSIGARGVVQLLYADIDLAALDSASRSLLGPFAQLGLADSNFGPKPALAAWDMLNARPLA